MTDRLTSDWTVSLTEAYGPTGSKGERGELNALRLLRQMGYENVTHHPSSLKLQKAGIDITFTRGNEIYAIDVKNNLAGHKDVCVEWAKLRSSEADYWMHVNDNNAGDFVLYKVDQMVKHLIHFPQRKLFWVSREEINDFGMTY